MSDKPSQHKNSDDPVVYIPADTAVNIGNGNAPPPVPKYERRKWVYRRDVVKNLVKGTFGAKDDGN